MDPMKDFFRRDALAAHLGIELLEVAPGRAVAQLAVRDCHRNSVGLVHGAAMFALADFAFAAASNAHGTVAVALNANICFLRPPAGGTLTASASEVSLGRTVATYAIDVTDDSGRKAAVFQGMVFRKGDAINWTG